MIDSYDGDDTDNDDDKYTADDIDDDDVDDDNDGDNYDDDGDNNDDDIDDDSNDYECIDVFGTCSIHSYLHLSLSIVIQPSHRLCDCVSSHPLSTCMSPTES